MLKELPGLDKFERPTLFEYLAEYYLIVGDKYSSRVSRRIIGKLGVKRTPRVC